ncbi:disease resistance protein RPV1-like [Eucalyptus grandis]|uniref:disease resistance protein RPV1-like n=1 Tax=Eucalyptus grandis TaxID=71139 RepID=UPI00192EBBC0|nr:disease resistance protein RPV1-like [Eucalyptus grandis]
MKRDLVLAHNSVQTNETSARRKADDASACSSSAASTGSDNYDVLLSLSGKDTRKTFADHLYNGLVDAGIHVFRDNNELREGEKIGTNLLQAIKNSKISISILSQNYASSKWCLQELVEMTKCIKSGHVVLPIFYHVEPTDVRNQKGSFGEAFSCLSRKYWEDVEKWKVALQEVASLKGWESEKTADGHEGELVKVVVKKVLSELKKAFQLVVTEQLVGIDNVVEKILRLLDDNSSATQIVGIYGMGGIDDVDDHEQIKAFVGKHGWFAMGSKIIITTRIRTVLDDAGVNCKYELQEIAKDKSLILFSRHAFRRDFPPCEFASLSHDVVSTTGGLPLALEVIGSSLCGQNQGFWQDTLKKLQKVPHKKVRDKLMISYDALEKEDKQIFLDIACFFIEMI